jgi:trimeric autotransporter adhesin
MKPMPYLASKRFVLLTISLIAVALSLSLHSASAQGNVVGISANGGEGQTGAGATATGTGALAAGPNADASGLGAIAIGVDSNNGGVSATASGIGALAIGSDTQNGLGPSASGDRSIAIGDFARASATNAIAFGTSASAGFTNSTAIGANATTTRANQMSFGTATNTYTMSGITSAASTAAQSGPIQFVTTDLAGNLAAFNLTPALTNLNKRIENTRSEEQGGIALAIATANLRYDDRPGKISVAGGLGGFQHEGGGSLGLGYTAPNQRVRFNVSAGGSTHGDFGGGGGLSFTLN